MNVDAFPLLCRALAGRVRDLPGRLLGIRRILEQAEAAGSIPNPAYQDLRRSVGRLIEDGFREAKWFAGDERPPREDTEAWAVIGLMPALHTLDSCLRRVEAARTDHPAKGAALAFLREMAPLSARVNALKGKVVKRVVSRGDGPSSYVPPEVHGEDAEKVQDLLERAIESAYADLLRTFEKRNLDWLEEFLEARRRDPRLTPHDHFVKNRKFPETVAEYLLDRALGQGYSVVSGRTWVERPGTRQSLADAARKDADFFRERFVFKNLRKLVSIVAGKGNLSSAERIGLDVSLAGLQGSFRFEFTDGSSFEVDNSAVRGVSPRGRLFVRFPLTFHRVVLSDGTRMRSPSEEKMNTEFVRGMGETEPAGIEAEEEEAQGMGM